MQVSIPFALLKAALVGRKFRLKRDIFVDVGPETLKKGETGQITEVDMDDTLGVPCVWGKMDKHHDSLTFEDGSNCWIWSDNCDTLEHITDDVELL